VLTVRASLGTRLQELDALDSSGNDRTVQYKAMLSELQDLDYAKATVLLTQQKAMLEAAQQSFVRTSSLSLFNYL
jgi:flagellar hook-associated protein 3 FlgL